MATLRDVQLFTLERTFKKIASDFLSYEQFLSERKKSEINDPPDCSGFYGSWSHFYLNESYKKRDLHAVISGQANILQRLTPEQIDIDHPVFDCMIDTLLKQEEWLNKLSPENFKIIKLEDNEEYKPSKGEINLTLVIPILHDIISSAQNNATISQLLEDFLNNSNIKSLTKAVSVDASVALIPQIQEYVSTFSKGDQINIKKAVLAAEEKPIYSPNGNNQTFLASIFVCQFDSVGLFNPVFGYSDIDIYELALKYEAITLDFDESTFLKKLRNYKKLKSQGSN